MSTASTEAINKRSSSSSGSEVSLEFPEIPERTSAKDFAASNFSQVIFPEISDYFPPGKDVRVTYVVTEPMEPSSRDWVGLFRVGWTNAKEYQTFVWAPKIAFSEETDRTVTVVFTAYYLPSDKNEFYQFCYVTKQGHIRGASTPFQFREPSECDQFVEVEDETGMIVLKTKSAALQEQVDILNGQKDELEKKLKDLTDNTSSLESKLSDTSSQLEASVLTVAAKNEECIKLKAELETTEKSLTDVKSKLKAVEDEMEMQNKKLEQAALSISNLEKETTGLNDQLTKANLEHSKEIASLNEQLDSKVQKMTELECSVNDLTENLKVAQLKAEDLQQSSRSCNEEVKLANIALKKERDGAIAKAARCKEEKELFKDQFAHSEEARRDIMQQLSRLKSELKCKDTEIQEKAEKFLAYEEKSRMLKNELKDVTKQSILQKSAMESEQSNLEDKLNACEASKRLISNELTEARDHRDKLMSEMHQVKKEKDQIIRDLEASRRQLSELEKNYMSMKERAERGEQRFAEKEQRLSEEKTTAKDREREMLEQIEILKAQLESADMAVAAAASSSEKERNESGTQTPLTKSLEMPSDQAMPDVNAKDNTISDLKLQIEDLRTRLSMGAAAYTEKYKECHKLERKMKKLQNQKPDAKTIVAKLQASTHDSTASDSQDESARKSASPKPSSKDVPVEATGGNFMSKLEQLFMAIADPDVEEQEQSNRLKARLEEMEKNVQSQHSKYRKYKKLYQDEKLSRASDNETSKTEVMSLKAAVDDLKSSKEQLQHENEALKEQLEEFVKNSRDENIVKTREITDVVIPAPPSSTSICRFGNPYQESHLRSSSNTYPHENLFTNEEIGAQDDLSSESDLSDEFQLASTRFDALGLCPKNQKSDDSDVLVSHSLAESTIPAIAVIKRQPTRSPPLIEVISGDGHEDKPVSTTGTAVDKSGARRRKANRSKKSKTKRDVA